jgi:lysine 2,3-aminomutase
MYGKNIVTDASLLGGDWKWQQKNLINSIDQLLGFFPGLSGTAQYFNILNNIATRKLGLTPYLAGLIKTNEQQCPVSDDPIWLQVAPVWSANEKSQFEYDGESENWELPHEMVTDICQHKYDNRVIIRTANVCHAYCQFCYEALRTLEQDTQKKAFKKSEWQQTVEYIAARPEVEEVILSGGEPFMLSDERIDTLLSSLRAARPDIIIRIHTRALTFNPFRITDDLVNILRKWKVNAVGIHVSHQQEISEHFLDAVLKLQAAVPLIFAIYSPSGRD